MKATPVSVQPWDQKDFKIPGGGPYTPGGSQVFTMGNSMLRKTTYGNFPAQRFIMSCVYEGFQDSGRRALHTGRQPGLHHGQLDAPQDDLWKLPGAALHHVLRL